MQKWLRREIALVVKRREREKGLREGRKLRRGERRDDVHVIVVRLTITFKASYEVAVIEMVWCEW